MHVAVLDPRMLVQFTRYGLSGGAAVATLFLVLLFLVELLGVPSTVASALAFACAVPVNYGLQHRFVFNRSSGHALYFPRYLPTTALTVGLNTAVFWVLTHELGVVYVASQVITIAIIVPVNFAINRSFTFAP
jgi:putative flippase GtrA